MFPSLPAVITTFVVLVESNGHQIFFARINHDAKLRKLDSNVAFAAVDACFIGFPLFQIRAKFGLNRQVDPSKFASKLQERYREIQEADITEEEPTMPTGKFELDK